MVQTSTWWWIAALSIGALILFLIIFIIIVVIRNRYFQEHGKKSNRRRYSSEATSRGLSHGPVRNKDIIPMYGNMNGHTKSDSLYNEVEENKKVRKKKKSGEEKVKKVSYEKKHSRKEKGQKEDIASHNHVDLVRKPEHVTNMQPVVTTAIVSHDEILNTDDHRKSNGSSHVDGNYLVGMEPIPEGSGENSNGSAYNKQPYVFTEDTQAMRYSRNSVIKENDANDNDGAVNMHTKSESQKEENSKKKKKKKVRVKSKKSYDQNDDEYDSNYSNRASGTYNTGDYIEKTGGVEYDEHASHKEEFRKYEMYTDDVYPGDAKNDLGQDNEIFAY